MRAEATEVPGVREALQERRLETMPGRRFLPAGVLTLVLGLALLASAIRLQVHAGPSALRVALWVLGIVFVATGGMLLRGLRSVRPGEGVAVELFGQYLGTLRSPGLLWASPWAKFRRISLKIRTYETSLIKVNDAEGNPIEISALVVWQVEDTSRALYAVDDFTSFVSAQCEAAVRHVASRYRYDTHGDGRVSLCSNADEIARELTAEISIQVQCAGIRVHQSRIVRLSYAPEIAHSMLRRQQAAAIVAARKQIVEGAVGMVHLALDRLDEDGVVELDEERKAAMVSNLLVVLCSDHPAQAVVNASSLYH